MDWSWLSSIAVVTWWFAGWNPLVAAWVYGGKKAVRRVRVTRRDWLLASLYALIWTVIAGLAIWVATMASGKMPVWLFVLVAVAGVGSFVGTFWRSVRRYDSRPTFAGSTV